MSKEGDYKVFKEYIEEADFHVLVIEIPEDEIEDKLAFLARDKGQISKSFFEDYVIATVVANINQLLYHINQQFETPYDLLKIREELMEVITRINPALNPEKLVLNKNSVIKIKKEDELEDGEKPLTDNKYWNISYYDDLNKEIEPTDEAEVSSGKKEIKKTGKLKNIDDLEHTTVQRWWKRIGQYISIKQFKAEDAESILKHRYFHNRTSFGTFIVSVCVVDFEELFSMLDSMGTSARVAPPILIHELYQLCNSVNEFLTFENAQDLADESEENEDEPTKFRSGRKMSHTGGAMGQYVKKKDKKKFKEVPKEDLLKLSDNMKVFLVGQDEAIDNMTDAIQRASVGLKDPIKPIGSFLFAGQTGVGKTLASKVLADELIKDRDNLVTVDCSEYSSDHEYSKLIGAPSGYIGHEAGGYLTNAIMKNPFSVVVFDEVEKASYKVHELLLQILEEGRLTDGKGNIVPFNETVVIMTSNVGVKEVNAIGSTIGFGDVSTITDDKRGSAINKAIKKKFKPEFINRIDSIVYFKSLTKKDYMRIIDIELYKLNDNLRSNDTEYKNIEIKFNKKIKDLIYEKGINEEYGARPLKREIEKMISTPLAQKLLKEDIDVNSIVEVTENKGEATFKITKKVDNTPFYMSDEYKEKGATDV
jgi:ATP-dependent Clp protease ATP-binding subunit ClpA